MEEKNTKNTPISVGYSHFSTDISVWLQPLHTINTRQILGVHFKRMGLLQMKLFFADGISLTVGSSTSYYEILLYTCSNEEIKKAGGKKDNNFLER